MNRYLVTFVVMLAGLAVLASSPAGAKTSAGVAGPGGTWGKAREVAAALNQGGVAAINSVSCASAGNCSAGGFYRKTRSGRQHAFVVSQVGGIWGQAELVPGIATFQISGIHSVSCASAANCSAGGFYYDRSGDVQAFVVSQVGGIWGQAEPVPGITLIKREEAMIESVSCASAGNCSAGGYYWSNSYGRQQAFVVSQVGGTWGKAEQVPGLAALNTGRVAVVNSVSCASAGNCSAVGSYWEHQSVQQVFVVSQVHGTWGQAEQVPGTAALNKGGAAEVTSVSCGSAGNCSAGGYYATTSSGTQQAFVVSQVHGTWGQAEQVPGTAALNQGRIAGTTSVSCASAGNCSAGGFYYERPGGYQAFVVSQVHGTWGQAERVPGTAALNQGGLAWTKSVSCASAGNCSAGGFYSDRSGGFQAFVVSQVGGTWGQAEEVPGTAALNTGGNAQVHSVSCASAGNCSAGGYYRERSHGQRAFVVSQVHGT